MTSCLSFVTANLLYYEATSMQTANAALQYPIYQRRMTALAEGCAYMGFARKIPVIEYVQAIPEIMVCITDVNDVLSFYKGESGGEAANLRNGSSWRRISLEELHDVGRNRDGLLQDFEDKGRTTCGS
ncbi:hypothetical protein JVU11DRAFT_7483 [Chiua virens]|nr:hypothetical protein JVU11DRAFT_7483 [Chiua virens]